MLQLLTVRGGIKMKIIKEKENDILSIILERDELFKIYTSPQDELSAFLISEKERRENASLSLEIAIKAEASRQKSALERLFKLSSGCDFPAFYFSVLYEVKEEEMLRKMKVQEILERYSEEESRHRRASVSFNILFEARLRRLESEIRFPKDYQKELEFQKISR